MTQQDRRRLYQGEKMCLHVGKRRGYRVDRCGHYPRKAWAGGKCKKARSLVNSPDEIIGDWALWFDGSIRYNLSGDKVDNAKPRQRLAVHCGKSVISVNCME